VVNVGLEEIALADLEMSTPLVVGRGPVGTRVVVELVRGRFDGRLAGNLRGHSGGDWLTVGPDGTASLDVRFVLETDDGVLVYAQSHGRMNLTPGGESGVALLGTTFETAGPAYAWLNTTLAVTRAETAGNRLQYSIYRVTT
jgi:Protein of unknown function (DUF3237)